MARSLDELIALETPEVQAQIRKLTTEKLEDVLLNEIKACLFDKLNDMMSMWEMTPTEVAKMYKIPAFVVFAAVESDFDRIDFHDMVLAINSIATRRWNNVHRY